MIRRYIKKIKKQKDNEAEKLNKIEAPKPKRTYKKRVNNESAEKN